MFIRRRPEGLLPLTRLLCHVRYACHKPRHSGAPKVRERQANRNIHVKHETGKTMNVLNICFEEGWNRPKDVWGGGNQGGEAPGVTNI